MHGPENHPIILLVVASIIVSCIGAGIFSVWATYDVIPSSLDNRFFKTSCNVNSTVEISKEEEKCSCFDEGLLCSDTYPCLVIKVLVKANRKSKKLILYKDLTSHTFSSKCSYYPLGKSCTGNSTATHYLAYKFKRYRGLVGSNFTCYINELENPNLVVAEKNNQDAAKLVLFILSVLFFFFPLIVMNCFFFYKWRLVAYLRLTLTRHHRVSVATSYGDNKRRDTAFTTANFHIE
ncbi:uncharacterized protein LOC116303792 [Actinia tenebrosa]|uniref:Uncharacterized protein LOC116303792 n=1 Tax=Actinia tenebrosa TaxID=6105 RepID=A0A6P8IQN2_ACTTE|nr:uncharacterized protein LOC116303792 [Actinia tenebrosa]